MATKLTIKRLDLIKAIEASALANQKAYDDAVAAQPSNDLLKEVDKAIEAAFKGLSPNGINNRGYARINAEGYAATFLGSVGISRTAIPAPQLYARQLMKLKLAVDDTLDVEDGSDYFSFLKP